MTTKTDAPSVTPTGMTLADLTLRDHFAAHALAGLCTPQASVSLGTADQIAQMAYRVADALVAQRGTERP